MTRRLRRSVALAIDEGLAVSVAGQGLMSWPETFLDVRDRGVKVSVVSPGLVAAGSGLLSDAGTRWPNDLLTPLDVAAAVRFVVTFPSTGCPTEIELQPQRSTRSRSTKTPTTRPRSSTPPPTLPTRTLSHRC